MVKTQGRGIVRHILAIRMSNPYQQFGQYENVKKIKHSNLPPRGFFRNTLSL